MNAPTSRVLLASVLLTLAPKCLAFLHCCLLLL